MDGRRSRKLDPSRLLKKAVSKAAAV